MIPEAAVEAAWHAFWNYGDKSGLESMRAALEAAAPHIIQAWVDEKTPLPEKLPSYRPIYPLGKIEDKRRHGND